MNSFLKTVLATMVGFFLCSVITFICYFVLFLMLGASIAGTLDMVPSTPSYDTLQDLQFN